MVLSDPTGTFGIQDEYGNTVVAAGTPLAAVQMGLYSYTLQGASENGTYQAYIKTTAHGSVIYSGLSIPPYELRSSLDAEGNLTLVQGPITTPPWPT